MAEYLGLGVLLGLSAGCSPGPLMALVLAHTLRYGPGEGIKVALSPLVTDLPIITVSLLLLSRLADIRPVFGAVSLCGGLFVAVLAWGTIRTTRIDLDPVEGTPRSLGKGVVTNLLSPHPYLFWVTVGAPTVIRGWSAGPGLSASFIAGFLGSLIGAKVAVAVAVGRSRQLLAGSAYGWVMRVLGVLLFIFSLSLVREGIALITGSQP